MHIRFGALVTSISIGLSLLAGCGVPRLMAPVAALHPRALIVATPTPSTGQLVVDRAYEQDQIALAPATDVQPSTQALDVDLSAKPLGVFVVVAAEVHNTGSAPLDLGATDLIHRGRKRPSVRTRVIGRAYPGLARFSVPSQPPGAARQPRRGSRRLRC